MTERSELQSNARPRRRPALGVIAACALVAAAVGGLRARRAPAADRDQALAAALATRGLEVDVDGVVWLESPPLGVVRSTFTTVPVAVRATPGPEEPHDIFLVFARLSPEGALLGVGGAYNLTETRAVDELAPAGGAGRFVFAEQMSPEETPSTVRFFDLGGGEDETKEWPRIERIKAAITRLQQTGRIDGVRRVTYRIEPPPERLDLDVQAATLHLRADERTATVALDDPLAVPEWLGVEDLRELRPPELVPWAVDRVRAEIGDEAMQYIKAIAFSALNEVLAGTESVTGDTGAEDIAADLGEESLSPLSRAIPVDPDIGFPPPPLEPWVTPALEGEGVWQSKEGDPFVYNLPGLPPTFVTTFIRSDKQRKATRVYVALWDPRLVQLNMMPGTVEPKSATGATGPGLIPREPKVMRRVAAAMNAGFQALHGEYGMMGDGVVYLPAKPYAATVAVVSDGSTAFGTWPVDVTIPPDVLSFRQNMTVMVQDEKFNPYGRTWWGGTPPGWEDKTHTVRTGICSTREGFVGYFYGADVSPDALAQAMIQTRCSYGVALDMNAGHSGMEFYRVAPEDQFEPLSRPLRHDLERTGKVAGMEGWGFRARRLIVGMGLMYFPRYIEREARDFFYLTVRDVLPGTPLGDEAWKVKGLPQQGFPYALATTHTALASGERAAVLKIDPRMVTLGKADGDGKVVAVVSPPDPAPDELSLWYSEDAFSIADAPLVTPAARVASGLLLSASAPVRAAIGVEEEGGMLVYVELEGDKTVPGKDLASVLTALGCAEGLLLPERLPLALGGDSNLQQQATRLPDNATRTTLVRKAGPGARRIFVDTPIVPLKEWNPLQARRIRYFKKKKDT